jgi:hypothetical protein
MKSNQSNNSYTNSKNKKNIDPLKALLQPELMDQPTAKLSDHLLHASMTSYRVSYSKKYRKEERLGKAIIAVLIFFNLMMLVKLNPFGTNPILLSGILTSVILIVGYGLFYLTRFFRPLVK